MTMAVTSKVTPTERKIAEMLLENTGASFLDSGGAYGRAWQNARAKYLGKPVPNSSFSGTPLTWPSDPDEDEIGIAATIMDSEERGTITDWGVTVNTFHWLVDRLTYHPELDAKYQRWERVTNFGKDHWNADWGLTLMERFTDQLHGERGIVSGIYGDGEAFTENTYNGEDALDRTLQYTFFSFTGTTDNEFLPDGTYVLLQIHGGCDVRGGYTDPVLFEVTGDDDSCMFDNARVEVWCEGANVLPEGIVDGQVSMDAEIVHPHAVNHRWDNVYDNGGTLRLSYDSGEDLSWWGQGKEEQVLVFLREDEEADDKVRMNYTEPAVYATANNATKDDNGVWHCPFDGSPLHAGGAFA
jgi:hypothetical protein